MNALRPTARFTAPSLAAALAALVAALAPATAHAQTALLGFASGEVAVVRGSGRVPAAAGMNLVAGDTVSTGAGAVAQVHLPTGSEVALAPSSELRIESLGTEPSLRLERGMLRTATPPADWPPSEWPLTGPAPRRLMQVSTSQATILVRGLHARLMVCAPAACRDPAGSAADAGLYGAVFDGSMIVTARATTSTFGQREFFVVPDGGTPRRLIAPPRFLAGVVPDKPLADAHNVAFRKVPELPLSRSTTLFDTVRDPYQATEDESLGRPVALPIVGVVGSDDVAREFVNDVTSDRLRIDSLGQLTGVDTRGLSASLGTASLADTGSAVSGGANLNWGRWTGPGSTITQTLPDGSVVSNDGGNLHYVYGIAAKDIPTAGVVEYALVGGTQPTDSGTGSVGALVSGGRVAVNFNIAQVSLVGLQVGFTDATYTMSGTASLAGPLFSTGGTGATGTCAGAACQPIAAANFAGFLAGPGAAGLGLDYYFNTRTGVIEGAAGYRRCAAPGAC
jgi:hypothetical protein